MTGIDPRTLSDLLTAGAVRERTNFIYEAGLVDSLPHFRINVDKIPAAATYVVDTIKRKYTSLQVPPHSRWRHLNANGRNWSTRLGNNLSVDHAERARQCVELSFVSVLLDAGSGPKWSWSDPATGRQFARSEGLALASLEAYADGVFSADPVRPCRVDAIRLKTLSAADLEKPFQVNNTNPLIGLDGRVSLLKSLGDLLLYASSVDPLFAKIYGSPARLGGLFDHIIYTDSGHTIQAPDILRSILTTFGNIWPGRITIDGDNLGDTWRHPAVKVSGPTNGLVPFHKLSQWLTYSLIEPLKWAGINVTHLDGLTGLAEYRNGGLFIDMGVIVPRDPTLPTTPLTPDLEPIVEWRALTVALLDEIAPLVRRELGVTAAQMPLASILEGGTWAAGRRIAKEKRADGGPPLTIVSDGTVF